MLYTQLKLQKLLALTLVLFTFYACTDDNVGGVDCDVFAWEYEGGGEPQNWSLCFDNCGGDVQSPVNIADAVANENLAPFEVNYQPVPIKLSNNGHTIEFEYGAGSTLSLNNKSYNLLQFHFHSASEHTVDGNQFPMEIHLVHQNAADESLAVIGLFFKEGEENEFLKSFFDNLPTTKSAVYEDTANVNVEDLMPMSKAYYTYTGSLTTPPCSEIVTWVVVKESIEASKEQIDQMLAIFDGNFRPVQSLNGRIISEVN